MRVGYRMRQIGTSYGQTPGRKTLFAQAAHESHRLRPTLHRACRSYERRNLQPFAWCTGNTFADCPPAEILLVPGGLGTRRELTNDSMIEWIKKRAADAELVLSVCSGSLLLAKAGLLEGLTATTHHGALAELSAISACVTVDDAKRFVDNGKVITSGGISAGIDMSLHVVARLLGHDQAAETAHYMEYEWNRNGLA
jgi:transcriptional regulator GlxA family with amidase domain